MTLSLTYLFYIPGKLTTLVSCLSLVTPKLTFYVDKIKYSRPLATIWWVIDNGFNLDEGQDVPSCLRICSWKRTFLQNKMFVNSLGIHRRTDESAETNYRSDGRGSTTLVTYNVSRIQSAFILTWLDTMYALFILKELNANILRLWVSYYILKEYHNIN